MINPEDIEIKVERDMLWLAIRTSSKIVLKTEHVYPDNMLHIMDEKTVQSMIIEDHLKSVFDYLYRGFAEAVALSMDRTLERIKDIGDPKSHYIVAEEMTNLMEAMHYVTWRKSRKGKVKMEQYENGEWVEVKTPALNPAQKRLGE